MDETTGTEIDTAPEVSESSGPVEETTEQQAPDETGGILLGIHCVQSSTLLASIAFRMN